MSKPRPLIDEFHEIVVTIREGIANSTELFAIATALDPEPHDYQIAQIMTRGRDWADAHPAATIHGTLAFLRAFALAGATYDDLVSRDLDDLWTEMRVRDGQLG